MLKGERLKDYGGKQMEIAYYGEGEYYSIECTDTHEVIYILDVDEELTEIKEQTM